MKVNHELSEIIKSWLDEQGRSQTMFANIDKVTEEFEQLSTSTSPTLLIQACYDNAFLEDEYPPKTPQSFIDLLSIDDIENYDLRCIAGFYFALRVLNLESAEELGYLLEMTAEQMSFAHGCYLLDNERSSDFLPLLLQDNVPLCLVFQILDFLREEKFTEDSLRFYRFHRPDPKTGEEATIITKVLVENDLMFDALKVIRQLPIEIDREPFYQILMTKAAFCSLPFSIEEEASILEIGFDDNEELKKHFLTSRRRFDLM